MTLQQLFAALVTELASSREEQCTRSTASQQYWHARKAQTVYAFQLAYGLDAEAAEFAIDRAMNERYDQLLKV